MRLPRTTYKNDMSSARLQICCLKDRQLDFLPLMWYASSSLMFIGAATGKGMMCNLQHNESKLFIRMGAGSSRLAQTKLAIDYKHEQKKLLL